MVMSVKTIIQSNIPGNVINAQNNVSTTVLYPVMVGAINVNQYPNVSTSKFSFNASSGNLTLSGALLVNSGNGVTAIENSGSNGSGNIGSSTSSFNTVFAKSTSAQYADLAEVYQADDKYLPGTVLKFGGSNEVTIENDVMSTRVAGIVSDTPAYIMNNALTGSNIAVVALQGRVYSTVQGSVSKGDMLVSAGSGLVKACSSPVVGSVLGKSLTDFDAATDLETAIIEVVVGRD